MTDYRGEIANRDRWIKEHQAKIKEIEAELDQLWRDEGIASIGHEVPLGGWLKRPEPIPCRKCRKDPALVATQQRRVDAIVNGQLVKAYQDYYVYDLTDGQIWCQNCRNDHNAELRRRYEREERERNHKCDASCYHGGC